jgi:hypothetical protein
MNELEKKLKDDALQKVMSLIPVVGVQDDDYIEWNFQKAENVLNETIGQAKFFTMDESNLEEKAKQHNKCLLGSLMNTMRFTSNIVNGMYGSGYTKPEILRAMPGYLLEDQVSGAMLCVTEKNSNDLIAMAFAMYKEAAGGNNG